MPTLRLKLFKEKGRGREESGRIYPEPSTLSMNPLSSGILMLLFTLQCLQLIVVFVFVFFGMKVKHKEMIQMQKVLLYIPIGIKLLLVKFNFVGCHTFMK